jgi:hypothetical protein
LEWHLECRIDSRENIMAGLIIAIAGTLLLIAGTRRRRPAPQPVRVRKR